MAGRQAELRALIGAAGDQGTRRPPEISPATTSRQDIRRRGVPGAGAWNSALAVLRAHRPPPHGHPTSMVTTPSTMFSAEGRFPEVAASPRGMLPALW